MESGYTTIRSKCSRCGCHIGYITVPDNIECIDGSIKNAEIESIKHDNNYYFFLCDNCMSVAGGDLRGQKDKDEQHHIT